MLYFDVLNQRDKGSRHKNKVYPWKSFMPVWKKRHTPQQWDDVAARHPQDWNQKVNAVMLGEFCFFVSPASGFSTTSLLKSCFVNLPVSAEQSRIDSFTSRQVSKLTWIILMIMLQWAEFNVRLIQTTTYYNGNCLVLGLNSGIGCHGHVSDSEWKLFCNYREMTPQQPAV